MQKNLTKTTTLVLPQPSARSTAAAPCLAQVKHLDQTITVLDLHSTCVDCCKAPRVAPTSLNFGVRSREAHRGGPFSDNGRVSADSPAQAHFQIRTGHVVHRHYHSAGEFEDAAVYVYTSSNDGKECSAPRECSTASATGAAAATRCPAAVLSPQASAPCRTPRMSALPSKSKPLRRKSTR